MSAKNLMKVRKSWLVSPETKIHQPKRMKDDGFSVNDLRKFQGNVNDIIDEDEDDFEDIYDEMTPTEEELKAEQEEVENFNNKLSQKQMDDIVEDDYP